MEVVIKGDGDGDGDEAGGFTSPKEGDPCSVLLPSPSPHFGGSWRLEQKATTPAPAKKREHLSPHVTKTKRRGSWLWPPAFFFTSFWQKLEIGTKVHISDSCQKERAFNSTLVLSGGVVDTINKENGLMEVVIKGDGDGDERAFNSTLVLSGGVVDTINKENGLMEVVIKGDGDGDGDEAGGFTSPKEGDPCSVLLPSPSPHFGGSWRLEQKATTPAPAKKREHLSPHVTKTKRRGSWLWPPAFFFTSFWQKLEIGTKVHISDSCQKERAFNSTLVLSGGVVDTINKENGLMEVVIKGDGDGDGDCSASIIILIILKIYDHILADEKRSES
ncbi:hypothetical protein QTG54_014836 [Skeletonema marinoi]|uniref:Uncharacterized protein n=1 Tax=Skeletonema marinoi TaxID=267567 RepID=A0AAD8XVS7_9STRA|nr:hypothetical protein QTG54_014836 [Skeletonema marinoi]